MDATKYAAAHASPRGPNDARPTAQQIIHDEGLEGKLAGKVILITGCSSGIGIETARALSTTGATLYLTARDLSKAHAALGTLAHDPKNNIHLLELDLSSLASVRTCAAEFLRRSPTLNILINNAGIMILKHTLIASATPELPSRLIMVSSSAHRASEVDFTDSNFASRDYDAWTAYGQSKTAMIWTANEIDRRYGAQGLHAFSLHPGSIASGLQKYVSDELRQRWAGEIPADSLAAAAKSPEQGAATTVWAAVAKCLEGKGGLYLEDCQIIGPLAADAGLLDPGYAPWVYDGSKAERLYGLSMKLVGME